MFKKISLLFIISQAAGMYGSDGAGFGGQGFGDTPFGSPAKSGVDARAGSQSPRLAELVLDAEQEAQFEKLKALAGEYLSKDRIEQDNFWAEMARLPLTEAVKGVKRQVHEMIAADREAQRELKAQAEREEAAEREAARIRKHDERFEENRRAALEESRLEDEKRAQEVLKQKEALEQAQAEEAEKARRDREISKAIQDSRARAQDLEIQRKKEAQEKERAEQAEQARRQKLASQVLKEAREKQAVEEERRRTENEAREKERLQLQKTMRLEGEALQQKKADKQAQREREEKERRQEEELRKQEEGHQILLAAWQRDADGLEQSLALCKANLSYDRFIEDAQFTKDIKELVLLTDMNEVGSARIVREAGAVLQRIRAFESDPYGAYILGRGPRPVVVAPAGDARSGAGASAHSNRTGQNKTKKEDKEPIIMPKSRSNDPEKKGRSWFKPAVGLTLVTLATYGLWRWYTNTDDTKAKIK